MFQYQSKQIHSSFQNGKGQTKVNEVSIRGTKGFKSITIKINQVVPSNAPNDDLHAKKSNAFNNANSFQDYLKTVKSV